MCYSVSECAVNMCVWWYQVVNGMMEREDWEEAMKTPIGMLPTGSGNALCASSLYEAGSVL